MKTRYFRKPNPYIKFAFLDDWREVAENDRGVSVYFGSSAQWPPSTRAPSVGKVGGFDEECERTLGRGYVEVDATGKAVKPPTEAQRIEAVLELGPYVAFARLRELLISTPNPVDVLKALVTVMASIESDIDEHDTPFPTDDHSPPDVGAVEAYRAHFKRLLGAAQKGQPLSDAERRYTYDPGEE